MNIDTESKNDLEAIAKMLDKAIENGLAVEVVHAFGVERASGAGAQLSAWRALYEWDIA